MLSERLAQRQFWLLYVGFIVTFGTMHVTGMLGMPRRIYTYEADRGWTFLNQLTTVGAAIQALSFVVFLYNLLASLRYGAPAGEDPWNAWTLEWSTTSPPPEYNFDVIPTVHSRRPLWDLKHPDDPDWQYEHGDAGSTLTASAPATNSALPEPPPIVPERHLTAGQWGLLSFLIAEVTTFGTLIVTYLFYLGKDEVGPKPAQVLELPLVLGTTACLLLSSVTIHFAERSLERGNRGGFLGLWGATIALGVLFLVGTGYEWHSLIFERGLTISRNLFGTTYYSLVGLHALHVTGGVTIMLVVFSLVLARQVTSSNRHGVGLVSWYWHFVDAVWIVVFLLVYVVGR
jgi:heme/copper-type cytochrome/quinol oxidase subunit 3